jgi:hypothetical protein
MGEKVNDYSILVGKSEEIDHFEDLDLDGMATLKSILKTGSGGGGKWSLLICFSIGSNGGLL